MADFNGDGKADLLIVNNDSNSVSVLLGNGNGTFQAHLDYSIGNFPVAGAIGDVNGDGKTDVVAVNNGSNSLTVLLGDGDGSLAVRKDTPVGVGPQALATGDFKRDGSVDLAVADFGAHTVSILFGNGDGTFTSGTPGQTGKGPRGVIVADFNGDGIQDIATANMTDNTVSVLLGNGDGTFQAHRDFATGTAPQRLGERGFQSRREDRHGCGQQHIEHGLRFCSETATAPSRRTGILPLAPNPTEWRSRTSTATARPICCSPISGKAPCRCCWAGATAPFRVGAHSSRASSLPDSPSATSTATGQG